MPLALFATLLLGIASLAVAAYVYVAERSRRSIVERIGDSAATAEGGHLFGRAQTLPEQVARQIAGLLPHKWTTSEKTEYALVQAGFDGEVAPLVYAAARVTLFVALLLIAFILVPKQSLPRLLLDLSASAVIALLVPPAVIARRARLRQQRIRRSLPDALDLLVVCIEAGISLDAALLRVAKDLHSVHAELADELLVVTRKVNVGMPRAEALRGLWTRTGVEELRALVSHIVQAERWGTSSSKVLRVYSEALRRQRRQSAEKMAATAPVKMLLPLGIFIFPALLLVILGPLLLNVMTLFKK